MSIEIRLVDSRFVVGAPMASWSKSGIEALTTLFLYGPLPIKHRLYSTPPFQANPSRETFSINNLILPYPYQSLRDYDLLFVYEDSIEMSITTKGQKIVEDFRDSSDEMLKIDLTKFSSSNLVVDPNTGLFKQQNFIILETQDIVDLLAALEQKQHISDDRLIKVWKYLGFIESNSPLKLTNKGTQVLIKKIVDIFKLEHLDPQFEKALIRLIPKAEWPCILSKIPTEKARYLANLLGKQNYRKRHLKKIEAVKRFKEG